MGQYTAKIGMQIKLSLLEGCLIALQLPRPVRATNGAKIADEKMVRAWVERYQSMWTEVMKGGRIMDVNDVLFMQMMPIVQEYLEAHEFLDDENNLPTGKVFELVFF